LVLVSASAASSGNCARGSRGSGPKRHYADAP
jgi:hypothetical protein